MLNMTNLSKIVHKDSPEKQNLLLPKKSHCKSEARALIKQIPSWVGKMARWLRAVLQRAHIQFPTPTWWLRTIDNSSSRGYEPAHMHTQVLQTIHTYKSSHKKQLPSRAGEMAKHNSSSKGSDTLMTS